MQTCGVGQREDYGTVNVLGHFFDNLFGKGTWFCRSTDQNVRSDYFDDFEQVVALLPLPFIIRLGVGMLGRSELVLVRLEEETWFIDTPTRKVNTIKCIVVSWKSMTHHICLRASSWDLSDSTAIASQI